MASSRGIRSGGESALGLMNSAGRLLGKELIVLYRDRDTVFHSLNFVRFHGAPELFDEGVTSVPDRARNFLRPSGANSMQKDHSFQRNSPQDGPAQRRIELRRNPLRQL